MYLVQTGDTTHEAGMNGPVFKPAAKENINVIEHTDIVDKISCATTHAHVVYAVGHA